MNKELQITATFDLSKSFEEQIQNLEKLKEYWSKHSPTVNVSPKVFEIGPNEKKYLEISGKTRMNHRYKEMTREEQAILFLKDMGIEPIALSDDSSPLVFNDEEETTDSEEDPFL